MKQFGTFDTLEDRRELLILLDKLGGGLPDELAKEKRAAWLQWLARKCKGLPDTAKVNPRVCHPTGAYQLFVHIVGVLGVRIEDAAKWLEDEVRRQ